MRFSLLFRIVLLIAPLFEVGAAEFVGPEACKKCHPAAYQSWKSSGHARATSSLTAEQSKDGRCRYCHSPRQSEGISEVTCETCHGGGKHYSASYVMKDTELSRAVGLTDPTEKTCANCHDARAPSLKPFQFRERLTKLDHWTKEKKDDGNSEKSEGQKRPEGVADVDGRKRTGVGVDSMARPETSRSSP